MTPLDTFAQRARFGDREVDRLLADGMTEDDAVKAVTNRLLTAATEEERDALVLREVQARLEEYAEAEVTAGRRRRVVHDDGHVSYPRAVPA